MVILLRCIRQQTAAAFYFLIVLGLGAKAQSNPAVLSLNYDTLVAGTGNNHFDLSFPQWDPSRGKLLGVKISTVSTLHLGFTLRNVDNLSDTFRISVGNKDSISALKAGYQHLNSVAVGVYALDSQREQKQVPVNLLDRISQTDSVAGDLSSYIGEGKIALGLTPVFWSYVESGNHSSFYYSASLRDTIIFSLIYVYQAAAPTAEASLIGLSASKEAPGMVRVAWSIRGETAGRNYGVEISQNDGPFVTTGGMIPSVAGDSLTGYKTGVMLSSQAVGKAYLRIRIISAEGNISFSAVKAIDGDSATLQVLKLFPNPARDFIRLDFPDQQAGDWQVDIIGADGRVVQRNFFSHASLALVNFYQKLPAGVYFVVAMDRSTRRRYHGTFVVQ